MWTSLPKLLSISVECVPFPAFHRLAHVGICVGLVWIWVRRRTSTDAELSNYAPLALAFLVGTLVTQQTNVLARSPWLTRAIGFAAGHSFSLLLIHVTIVKLVCLLPRAAPSKVAGAVIASNVVAIIMALCFERHYRALAGWLKRKTIIYQSPSLRTENAA